MQTTSKSKSSSKSKIDSRTEYQPLSNKELTRLSVEAGKYLGKAEDDEIDTTEIVEQAVANGYDRQEARLGLQQQGHSISGKVAVPKQGDLLGSLWKPAKAPSATKQQESRPSTKHEHVKSLKDWTETKLEARRKEYDDGIFQHPVEHAYSYKSENIKFVQSKDVERYFVQNYSRFTTVLITYTRPRKKDESVVEHADGFYPRKIKRKRRECIKATGHFDEYAGVSLLAPKDVAPNASEQTTHGHDAIAIPTFINSKHFDDLRSMEGVDMSMQYHLSDKVEAPSAINRQDLENKRGATTALAQEVGDNLPILRAIDSLREKMDADASTNWARYKATLDATDCPQYVTRWCSHMSCGKDGKPKTNGIDRWRPLGRFNEIAGSMKENRDYCSMGSGAKERSKPDENKEAINLTDKQREFVDAYLGESLPPEPESIKSVVADNIDEFNGFAGVDNLIEAIQRESTGRR